tara:strand:+ start:12327 stop:13229 length:903 start_codon:yes stop_codon:yes gene_type:complete
MNSNYAPICLFTYNRLEETKKTVKALEDNFLAKESDLFIYSDGPKNESDLDKVLQVRSFLKSIEGFKTIVLIKSETNKGLANSIISGVSEVIKIHKKVIVLEDDLITSPNFLNFMNQSVLYYVNDPKVFSISGYTMDVRGLDTLEQDFYFGCRASSWGWATWSNRWESVDWEVSKYKNFISNKKAILKFNIGGSDMTRMLKSQMIGKIDSWAIRFCFQQYIDNMVCVFPKISKVQSIGFSKDATHTVGAKKFLTKLDDSNKTSFKFNNFIKYDEKLIKAFGDKFSIVQRIKDKLILLFHE